MQLGPWTSECATTVTPAPRGDCTPKNLSPQQNPQGGESATNHARLSRHLGPFCWFSVASGPRCRESLASMQNECAQGMCCSMEGTKATWISRAARGEQSDSSAPPRGPPRELSSKGNPSLQTAWVGSGIQNTKPFLCVELRDLATGQLSGRVRPA